MLLYQQAGWQFKDVVFRLKNSKYPVETIETPVNWPFGSHSIILMDYSLLASAGLVCPSEENVLHEPGLKQNGIGTFLSIIVGGAKDIKLLRGVGINRIGGREREVPAPAQLVGGNGGPVCPRRRHVGAGQHKARSRSLIRPVKHQVRAGQTEIVNGQIGHRRGRTGHAQYAIGQPARVPKQTAVQRRQVGRAKRACDGRALKSLKLSPAASVPDRFTTFSVPPSVKVPPTDNTSLVPLVLLIFITFVPPSVAADVTVKIPRPDTEPGATVDKLATVKTPFTVPNPFNVWPLDSVRVPSVRTEASKVAPAATVMTGV